MFVLHWQLTKIINYWKHCCREENKMLASTSLLPGREHSFSSAVHAGPLRKDVVKEFSKRQQLNVWRKGRRK